MSENDKPSLAVLSLESESFGSNLLGRHWTSSVKLRWLHVKQSFRASRLLLHCYNLENYAEWACIIHEVMGVVVLLGHLQSKQALPCPKRATVTLEVQHQELGSPEVHLITLGLSFLFPCTPSGCFASIFLSQRVPLSVDLPLVVVPSCNCNIYPTTHYSRKLYSEAVKTGTSFTISMNIFQMKWVFFSCASHYSAVWYGFEAGFPFTCCRCSRCD